MFRAYLALILLLPSLARSMESGVTAVSYAYQGEYYYTIGLIKHRDQDKYALVECSSLSSFEEFSGHERFTDERTELKWDENYRIDECVVHFKQFLTGFDLYEMELRAFSDYLEASDKKGGTAIHYKAFSSVMYALVGYFTGAFVGGIFVDPSTAASIASGFAAIVGYDQGRKTAENFAKSTQDIINIAQVKRIPSNGSVLIVTTRLRRSEAILGNSQNPLAYYSYREYFLKKVSDVIIRKDRASYIGLLLDARKVEGLGPCYQDFSLMPQSGNKTWWTHLPFAEELDLNYKRQKYLRGYVGVTRDSSSNLVQAKSSDRFSNGQNLAPLVIEVLDAKDEGCTLVVSDKDWQRMEVIIQSDHDFARYGRLLLVLPE